MHPDFLIDLDTAKKAVQRVFIEMQGKHFHLPRTMVTEIMVDGISSEYDVSKEWVRELIWNDKHHIYRLRKLKDIPVGTQIRLIQAKKINLTKSNDFPSDAEPILREYTDFILVEKSENSCVIERMGVRTTVSNDRTATIRLYV